MYKLCIFILPSIVSWFRHPTIVNALDVLLKDNSTDRDENILTINTGADLVELCNQLNITRDACSCVKTKALCPFELLFGNVGLNSSETDYRRSTTHTIIYASMTIFVSVFGLAGNLVVIVIAFYKRDTNLAACKLHIAQLAVVNFVFSILQIVNVVPLFWTNQWIYGTLMCKFIRTFLEMCTLLTILFISIIAIERFFLIVYPNRCGCYETNLKHCIVGFAILFVTITVIPFYIGLRIEESGRCVQFGGNYKDFSLPYSWFVIIVYFLLPGMIVTSLYTIIIKYISRETSNIDRHHNSELHQRKSRTNRRVVYITLTILFCFLICTLPTRTSLLYIEMQSKRSGLDFNYLNPDLYFTLTFVSYTTYPFQSSVNPILYSFVDSGWRREVRKFGNTFMRMVVGKKEGYFEGRVVERSNNVHL